MEQLGPSGGENIKVFVRVRPPDPNLESELGRGVCLDVTSETTLTVYSKPEPKVFTFDHVADKNITQEDVFSAIGRPIIDCCMCGYNGTIFAYGQTGSGKTFTMIGPPSEDSSDTFTHELRGIIPRSFEYLFSFINRNKQKYGELVEFLCKCSFLEIYNEQVFDLLDPASSGLHLRENMKRGVYVDGVTETSVSSAKDAYQVLSTGWVNRKVASTSMNRESSRSHAVFTLSIESKKREAKDAVAKIRTSLLNLVDLAGSERQRDTQTAGLRLKEAGSINKSLSALGNVIMALVDIANGKSRHVHYRDSKLTFLLRDSLGGNAKTNLVANVHPSARCFGESLSTLNFARRAKMIRNKAIVNEDATGNVLQLQGEIKRLRGLIQRYKSENAAGPSTLHLSSPFPILSDTSCRSDNEKAIQELKSMLTASIEARDRANIEKTELLDRVERQQQLSDKKDKFIQSTKMILKFREAHISNLEKAQKAKSPADSSQENTTKLQRQEIEHLKRLVEHHPDSGRLARENVDLKAELKKLRASVSTSGKENLSRQLDHSHQYTLQLERQLRHYLAKNSTNGISPMSARLAPSTPTKATFDLEGLQVRCKQLQEELENTRRLWNHEREDLQLRESKLEANLTAARKANMELERSIEALKLKNNVEKSTLNDIHMATIKTILTPKRERDQLFRNRSMSCTPTSHIHRADSDPIKHQLSFVGKAASIESPLSHPSSPLFPTISEAPERQKDSHLLSGNGNGNSTPHAKKPRLSQIQTLCESEAGNDVSEKIDRVPKVNGIAEILEDSLNEEGIGRGEEEEEEEEELDELNVRGALTDELKILQDRNRSLQQQLEDLERRVVHLTQVKGALEAQVEELTQLSRLEREGYYDKEQGYLEKIANLASQIADLKSTNGVLESEVYDLRVCLKSADKELKEVKDEKGEMKRSHDSKVMSYAQKIGELERLYSSEESKYNRAMEELQNLQDEVETLREELTFKDHRISELEEVLKKEKEAVSAHEVEVQSLLEKLTLEVERSTRLSLELQEGHTGNQELIATVNENTRLHDEVEQLESELQTRLQTHKRHMEEAEGTISALLKKKATDEAAITGFVATIQELRSEKVKDESRVVSMTRELEDSARDLAAAVTKNGDLAEKVEFLHKKLSEEAAAHGRELMKRDAEREIVFDDLESLNDQYQQLTMAFELQTRKLSETQVDLERANGELERVENEMSRLLQGKIEKRASTSKMQSLDEDLENNSEEEIKQLKRQLDQAAEMIEGYEKSREEKNKELQSMKEQVSMVEKLKEECDSLQATIAELHYKLSYEKEHEDSLSSQLQASTDVIKQLQQERDALITEKEIAIARNLEIAEKCQHHQECMAGLTEQIDRYKSSEENLFQAKENIRSQLEMLQEEKAKLSKECEKLAKENAAITGHHNIRQRIQYHATVKIENAKLKEEVIQLHSRLRRKTEQVDKLQHILTEKGLEITNSRHTSSKGRTINDANQQQQKENITP